MNANEKTLAKQKLRLALDMFQAGAEMMKKNIERANPTLTEAEIHVLHEAWLKKRPGAKYGDAEGRPIDPVRFYPTNNE